MSALSAIRRAFPDVAGSDHRRLLNAVPWSVVALVSLIGSAALSTLHYGFTLFLAFVTLGALVLGSLKDLRR